MNGLFLILLLMPINDDMQYKILSVTDDIRDKFLLVTDSRYRELVGNVKKEAWKHEITDKSSVSARKAEAIFWEIKPRIYIDKYALSSLKKDKVKMLVRIYTNKEGRVIFVKFLKNSGSWKIDDAVRKAILKAKFRPYLVNGVSTSIFADLPILIK